MVRLEAGALHAARGLGVLHKDFPKIARAGILSHQHGDSGVDSDDIAVVPILQRVQRIHEAITAPGLPIPMADVSNHAHTFLRKERDRSAGSGRSYGSVNRSQSGRTTPDDIATHGIGGSDSPEIRAVIRKLLGQLHAEAAMDFGGNDRVLEVIRVAVALATEIEPGLRVLMYEQRRERANETNSLVVEDYPLPGIPNLRAQRIGGGAETEQVHHHHLVVIVPAIR